MPTVQTEQLRVMAHMLTPTDGLKHARERIPISRHADSSVEEPSAFRIVPTGDSRTYRLERSSRQSTYAQSWEELLFRAAVPAEGQRTSARAEHFFAKADELLQDEIEPGEPHPFADLLAGLGDHALRSKWLARYYSQRQGDPSRKRSVVLAIGRLPRAEVTNVPEFEAILRSALKDDDLGVREAAVRAAEAFGAFGLALLDGFQEQVLWLRKYADGVRGDLLRRIQSR